MGQDIGTTIVKLTCGEGLGLGLEPTEFIQGQALPWLLFIPIPCQVYRLEAAKNYEAT